MMYPLVRDLAAAGAPVRVPVAVACRVLKFSPQAYYKWLTDPVSQRDWDDAHLINAAVDIHEDDPEFGYRFIADELAAQGFAASENRVHRICALQQIYSSISRRGRRTTRSGPPAHDDLVQREFVAAAPNAIWLTDITEHPTSEGKLYICLVKDCFAGRIVGYSMGPRMTADLAVNALNMAVAHRGSCAGVIVHSDRGSQYRSKAFRTRLTAVGAKGSMGQVHTCADNAAMESFNSLLQKNVLDRQRTWATRAQLRLAVISWIEGTYHRRRRQRRLGKLTPIEFETIHAASTEAVPIPA